MSNWRKGVKKDSPFLYYFDIEGKTPLKVTISGTSTEKAFCPGKSKPGRDENGDFDDGKSDLLCVEFKGATKKLGLNMTNGELFERATGTDDEAKWAGKEVWLRVAKCKGEKCIRVHAKKGTVLPKTCPKYNYIDQSPDATKPAPEPDNATPADQVEAML